MLKYVLALLLLVLHDTTSAASTAPAIPYSGSRPTLVHAVVSSPLKPWIGDQATKCFKERLEKDHRMDLENDFVPKLLSLLPVHHESSPIRHSNKIKKDKIKEHGIDYIMEMLTRFMPDSCKSYQNHVERRWDIQRSHAFLQSHDIDLNKDLETESSPFQRLIREECATQISEALQIVQKAESFQEAVDRASTLGHWYTHELGNVVEQCKSLGGSFCESSFWMRSRYYWRDYLKDQIVKAYSNVCECPTVTTG